MPAETVLTLYKLFQSQGAHPMSDTKKTYVQPSVELLGSIAEKTEFGEAPPGDGIANFSAPNPLAS